jgi:UDP-N-acetylglucosamine--N-acetylmuramyl-(pentapeptide) pyrophosphoryl-undecaprenol N-acetylglucosamine transferase
VVIAGGGTGGHLFPGIAVAEEILGRNPKNEVLFIGTERGLENRILHERGFRLKKIDIEGIKGRGILKAVKTMFKIPHSVAQSWSIIRDFRPDFVLGVGGYASGPAVMAAYFIGIKTAIAEQNVLPGLTNRILGRFSDKIFISFTETGKWFQNKKVIVTGNPVRMGFFEGGKNVSKPENKFTILVFGGSQGASSINRAFIESLNYMDDIKSELRIIHQTGAGDMDKVLDAYRDCGVEYEVYPFIDDMASAYKSADLLICRSGATSIAEITASGKAALFIPYPFAAGNHQEFNARVLVERGAAEMILEKDLDGQKLADTIKELYRNPGKIAKMEKKSALSGNRKAAARIVDECMELVVQREDI